MRIGLISSAVPLVRGGYRLIAEWLEEALIARGHEVETIYLPSTDTPATILQQMNAFRNLKLDPAYERVITLRPPAHVVQHSNKVIWFIHHIRVFYDLWGHGYSSIPDVASTQAIRDQVIAADTAALIEAKRLFTNSRVVADRIRRFNKLEAEVLYPPISKPERFKASTFDEEIVCICRMEHHKRQHLLIEALSHSKSKVRLRLCGCSMSSTYPLELELLAKKLGVAERVIIETRWITEQEKISRFACALAAAYIPFDEDSYGFPTIEAAHARLCTITVSDSGGVLEFVRDEVTGLIVQPTPKALGAAFDRLFLDRTLARRLGEAACSEIVRLNIDWDHVVERLLL